MQKYNRTEMFSKFTNCRNRTELNMLHFEVYAAGIEVGGGDVKTSVYLEVCTQVGQRAYFDCLFTMLIFVDELHKFIW